MARNWTEAYTAQREQVEEKVRALRVLMDGHGVMQADCPAHYGYVGDLVDANEKLAQILAQLQSALENGN